MSQVNRCGTFPHVQKGELMKKGNFIGLFFTGLVLAVFIAGCAGISGKESTGEYVDDPVLKSEVKTDRTDGVPDQCRIFQENSQISGFADSSQASAGASEMAKSVKVPKLSKTALP
jgi:hypothetical protein